MSQGPTSKYTREPFLILDSLVQQLLATRKALGDSEYEALMYHASHDVTKERPVLFGGSWHELPGPHMLAHWEATSTHRATIQKARMNRMKDVAGSPLACALAIVASQPPAINQSFYGGPIPYVAGQRVVVKGLRDCEGLNGRFGKVRRFDESKGRYAVEFGPREAGRLIKTRNLDVVMDEGADLGHPAAWEPPHVQPAPVTTHLSGPST